MINWSILVIGSLIVLVVIYLYTSSALYSLAVLFVALTVLLFSRYILLKKKLGLLVKMLLCYGHRVSLDEFANVNEGRDDAYDLCSFNQYLFRIQVRANHKGIYLSKIGLFKILIPWGEVSTISDFKNGGVSITFGRQDIVEKPYFELSLPWNLELQKIMLFNAEKMNKQGQTTF